MARKKLMRLVRLEDLIKKEVKLEGKLYYTTFCNVEYNFKMYLENIFGVSSLKLYTLYIQTTNINLNKRKVK